MNLYANFKLAGDALVLAQPMNASRQLLTSANRHEQTSNSSFSEARGLTEDCSLTVSDSHCRPNNRNATFAQLLPDLDGHHQQKAEDDTCCINPLTPKGQLKVQEGNTGLDSRDSTSRPATTKPKCRAKSVLLTRTPSIAETQTLASQHKRRLNRSKSQEPKADCDFCLASKKKNLRRDLSQYFNSFCTLSFLEQGSRRSCGSEDSSSELSEPPLEFEEENHWDDCEETSISFDLESWLHRPRPNKPDLDLLSIAKDSLQNCPRGRFADSVRQGSKEVETRSQASMIQSIPESEDQC